MLLMAAVVTRISTLGHGLPLLPTLAEHQCVVSSVPWRPGKTGDSAVERLFTGKTLVGLAAWIGGLLKGQPADTIGFGKRGSAPLGEAGAACPDSICPTENRRSIRSQEKRFMFWKAAGVGVGSVDVPLFW